MPNILVEMASRAGQHEIAEAFKSIKDPVIVAAGVATEKATLAQTSAATAVQAKNDAVSTATALTNYLETKETLTAPAVDTTLSVSGAAADAKATGDAFKEAITNMSDIPSCDINDLSDTYGNIVGLLVEGTSYTNAPYNGFIGTIFSVKLTSISSIQFAFEYSSGGIYYRKKTSILTPPWTDWILITDTSKGALPNNTDLDTVIDKGIYTFQYGYTYTNLPSGLEDVAGIFRIYYISDILQYQTIHTVYPNGKLYIRMRVKGTWTEWFETGNGEGEKYAASKKYVAFGDSLTWGSVWSSDSTTPLFQAGVKYRIPTRIALATGLINNFVNEGVGGTGYIHQSGGQTITSKILNYDLTNVQLVTVMGGANDTTDSVLLGTSASSANDGTICGAIKSIIDYIKSSYSKTQLVVIQPSPFANSVDQWNHTYPGGWSLNDFDREVSALCHNNHVGYVNWWESLYCDTWASHSGGYSSGIGPNYSHPKVEGDYALLGDFIGGKVSALIKGRN